jgi:hypothetical protein
MDGTSVIYGSCGFLVDGVRIRGARKPEDTCEDFEIAEREK